ncbi:GNAT family N-acetyltransferase [Ideonella sp. 4Y16]|nr:aminoglycoside 6'-N-acetyltransferase [Ideonella alba]MBQ0943668.1 GNAT family N-acetyltransferase [Ideonella alba]
MHIARLADPADPRWLALRRALWDDSRVDEHLAEMAQQCADAARYATFLACAEDGTALGMAEAALRHDYVNGTDSSPVLFLEGLYVAPAARRQGLARALVAAAADWGRARGCTEMASDTPLDNTLSQTVHARLGFTETERLVCFAMSLNAPG